MIPRESRAWTSARNSHGIEALSFLQLREDLCAKSENVASDEAMIVGFDLDVLYWYSGTVISTNQRGNNKKRKRRREEIGVLDRVYGSCKWIHY